MKVNGVIRAGVTTTNGIKDGVNMEWNWARYVVLVCAVIGVFMNSSYHPWVFFENKISPWNELAKEVLKELQVPIVYRVAHVMLSFVFMLSEFIILYWLFKTSSPLTWRSVLVALILCNTQLDSPYYYFIRMVTAGFMWYKFGASCIGICSAILLLLMIIAMILSLIGFFLVGNKENSEKTTE